jgi:hypothetical protein
MGSKFSYHRNAERPGAKMWLFDDDGSLIDLSSGYDFVFKIGNPGATALLTKNSNITGAVGSGVEPTGTPNVFLSWSTGELDIEPGVYSWTLKATTSSLDRVFAGSFVILDDID